MSGRSRIAVIAIATALATIALYWPTTGYGFISLDDPRYVTSNPHIQDGLTAAGVRWAFGHHGYASNYHPLTWLSHMLDVQLFGAANAGAQHAINFSLHALAAVLLFLALVRVTQAPWASAWIAAMFALHPQRVESVAWIAERKDVLAALLWMATVWSYAHWADSRRHRWYAATLVLFAAGLLAKPLLVTLPLALVLLDIWPLGRLRWSEAGRRWWPAIVDKLPLLALSGAASLVTLQAQERALSHVGWSDRLANAAVSYVAYLRQMAWPVDLAVFYPHPASPTQVHLSRLEITAAVALLLAVTLLVLWGARRGHLYLLTGWLWYAGTLVPMIGFIHVGSAARADRYTYVPSIGILLLLAFAGRAVIRRWPAWRRPLTVGAIAALVAATASSTRQVALWQDDYHLFGHTVRVTNNNVLASTLYGAALERHDERAAAIEHLTRATRLDPREVDARVLLGQIHLRDDQPELALRPLRQALAIDGTHQRAHLFLGQALLDADQPDSLPTAIRHLQQALTIATDDDVRRIADRELAAAFERMGDPVPAVRHYGRYLAERPQAKNNLRRLAWLLATVPEVIDGPRALELAQQALDLSDGKDQRYFDVLAAAQATTGQFAAAVATAERALALLAPNDPDRPAIEQRLELYRQRLPYRHELQAP